jgi:hypothetical protein
MSEDIVRNVESKTLQSLEMLNLITSSVEECFSGNRFYEQKSVADQTLEAVAYTVVIPISELLGRLH